MRYRSLVLLILLPACQFSDKPAQVLNPPPPAQEAVQQHQTTSRTVSTLAGRAGSKGNADGTGSTARFFSPQAVAVDASGTVYVADGNNNSIRKITTAGHVSTLAGAMNAYDPKVAWAFGERGSRDGTGAAARFNYPSGVAVDAAGSVYVADQHNHTIRKITAAGVVSTLAGMAGEPGSVDGPGTAARFYAPTGVAVDAAGTVYVTDVGNFTIRKITAAGVVSTLAGTVGSRGSTDSTGRAARFGAPHGIAVDAGGTVYVTDVFNNTIRKITAAGVVSTLAGRAGNRGRADGRGTGAAFHSPSGVAVDRKGMVYVADSENGAIRLITPAGVVSTLVGPSRAKGSTDVPGAAARFNYPMGVPMGVAVDAAGTVYVADRYNHTIWAMK
ncbi:hypothetical protein DNI29_22145 [Hymenobacter sediminis]|uniref:NHL repeat-containing protein n=1 Tax=Hymenobacter sediminis TaxID=2218621 RepID=UPI000DA68CF4|nr:NHL repeat-containing protein [Hymenobacter sediminis]RPD44101.1 hypothetical protein DNI29_22145 [Hymenobacter sediminis]